MHEKLLRSSKQIRFMRRMSAHTYRFAQKSSLPPDALKSAPLRDAALSLPPTIPHQRAPPGELVEDEVGVRLRGRGGRRGLVPRAGALWQRPQSILLALERGLLRVQNLLCSLSLL